MQTPKFGDFLLYDGTFVSAPADAKEVKGIYLYDGISLIDFSPKRKMYRKACHWCWEHGGELASVKTLYFIIFHFFVRTIPKYSIYSGIVRDITYYHSFE